MKMKYIEGSVKSSCPFLNHQLDHNFKMSMLTISVVLSRLEANSGVFHTFSFILDAKKLQMY